MSRLNPEDFIGKIYQTNTSGDCFIIDIKNSQDITVMFYDGYCVKVHKGNLDKGKVKNPYHKNNLARGVGLYDRTINHNTTIGLKITNLWHNMLQRCYCNKFHERQTTYKHTTVCDRWLTYSNFENDILNMKNFNRFIEDGWELDKDLIEIGNNVYSSQTCCFVPKSLNSKFSQISKIFEEDKGFSILPYGSFRVKIQGTATGHLGCFKTKEEALSVYRKKKCEILLESLIEYEGIVDDRLIISVRAFINDKINLFNY